LIKRWAFNRARGLDVKGYPKKSSTEEGVPGIDCCASEILDTEEDIKTNAAMLLLKEKQPINYQIATEHYYYKMELSRISKKMGLGRSIVDSRHGDIKDFVADNVFY